MLTKVHGCCSYEEHAVAIAELRAANQYGERFCGFCGSVLQAGPERCPHSSLVINGRSLCELCRNHSDALRVPYVSPEHLEAYLDPPISELTAQEPQTAEPVVEFNGENFEQEEQYSVVNEE